MVYRQLRDWRNSLSWNQPINPTRIWQDRRNLLQIRKCCSASASSPGGYMDRQSAARRLRAKDGIARSRPYLRHRHHGIPRVRGALSPSLDNEIPDAWHILEAVSRVDCFTARRSSQDHAPCAIRPRKRPPSSSSCVSETAYWSIDKLVVVSRYEKRII